MVTRYIARLELLTTKNTEVDESLENSLREIKKEQKSLEDGSSKHNYVICTSAEADRLIACGHFFSKECLDRWEEVSDENRKHVSVPWRDKGKIEMLIGLSFCCRNVLFTE